MPFVNTTSATAGFVELALVNAPVADLTNDEIGSDLYTTARYDESKFQTCVLKTEFHKRHEDFDSLQELSDWFFLKAEC